MDNGGGAGGQRPGESGQREESEYPAVCVVTHPLGAAGENATRTLLEILGAITAVSLVTANLPGNSTIRDRYEVVELTSAGAGQGSVPVAAFRFLVNQLRMAVAVARRDEPVILFFGATSYLLPVLVARLTGHVVVLEPRGDVPLTLRLAWETHLPAPIARGLAGAVRLLESSCYHLASAIVTYTPSMARELGLDRFAGKLHPSGARYVDVDQFSPETPMMERPLHVGFVGRLAEEKGVRTLAEVAARLPEDVTFVFVGDGPLRPWLKERLAGEVSDGSVEIRGWVDHDDIPATLDGLRLLVMPSQPTEGLPTTILEAMACGAPAYASPVSGVPDVIVDGETGFLMTETGPEAISGRIERILHLDDLARIGENARDLAVSTYGFEAAVDRYRDILAALDR